jgi:hypothetical protein
MERIEKTDIARRKLYLGPMSKNIVDAIINYNTNVQNIVGITTSRRQIDYSDGYVNNWKTATFNSYVKNKNILICRDHAGPLQGKFVDDGIDSLLVDAEHWNIIHIDPFKFCNLHQSIDYTIRAMEECTKINSNIFFEVGTEESIFSLDEDDLYYFLNKIKKKSPELFENIIYAVIQSGTSLKAGKNIGEYNENKLKEMVNVCQNFNILSKEHNGDYLTPEQIKHKFNLGLCAINIAPEIAHIETEYILNNRISNEKIQKWYELCLKNNQYKKWFQNDFNPDENKIEIVRLCGHYVFTYTEFSDIFDLNSASQYVIEKIHEFINERI